MRDSCRDRKGRRAAVATALALAMLAAAGCGTPAIVAARHDFYQGRWEAADRRLSDAPWTEKDKVLGLMERGTIRLARGAYEASAKDFLEAADTLEQLETYSVSKGAASLVVNDSVQAFRGAPYERTLLHTLCAQSYLARGLWDDAAVEARRLIASLDPERIKDYPQDPFSRYVAGVCFELIDDPSNAAIEYRHAAVGAKGFTIDEQTGRFHPLPPETPAPAPEGLLQGGQLPSRQAPAPPPPVEIARPPASWTAELIGFVHLGRGPGGAADWPEDWTAGEAAYADFYIDGLYAGRSYPLGDTVALAWETSRKQAAVKAVKTVTRIVLKETAAHTVARSTDSDALGDLVRLILIGLLEEPDVRRWETLPQWMQAARLPCPENLTGYRVVFRQANGAALSTMDVTAPLMRRRRTFVTFCRDLVPQPEPTP